MTPREECAAVCTSGCHADDCEHHGHLPAETPEPPALDDWMLSVVRVWRAHWEGSTYRYGEDFAAFLGERLMTDFNLRDHEPYPFGHARLSSSEDRTP